MTMLPPDLTTAWAEHHRLLAQSVAIQQHLLHQRLHRRIGRALGPGTWRHAAEAVGSFALLLVLGPIVAAHAAQPRYLLAGVALLVFAVGFGAHSARAAMLRRRIDPADPVLALQQTLERIRIAEFRALLWAVLGGVLGWLPVLLLSIEAGTGIPVLAKVDPAWLLANLTFGATVLVAGTRWARRHLDRQDRPPFVQRLLLATSGAGVRAAQARLAELAEFAAVDHADR